MSSIWQRIRDGIAELGWASLFGLPSGNAEPDAGNCTIGTRQVAFTIAAIALGAKMSAADGVSEESERRAFHEVFHTPPEERRNVDYFFDLARRSTAGAESYARKAARLLGRRKAVLEDLLGALFHIARADGNYLPAEDQYLQRIAKIFGFDEAEFARIRAYHIGEAGNGRIDDDPWLILDVPRGAAPDEIKRRWRDLVKTYHPDRAIAQGLPPEFVAIANHKLARINAAYRRLSAVLMADAD